MKNYLLITAFLLLVFQSCYKEPDFTNFDYETYNRVVGPLGGEINFYANYGNDSDNSVLVNLSVPEGALDSVLVFNMYQFEDYELVLQMQDGYAEIGSKFLYLVPFYESEGYHERGKLDLSYHLSIDFNQPITVTYNFLADGGGLSAESWQESQLYYDHYKKTNRTYKLYRIKIPRLDEWGETDNIYVNWNNQGYPDGYDRTDLYYIISGIWSPLNEWGTGYLSLENWEPVPNFNLNNEDNSLSYDISNTDYIYVLCRITYIKAENVPIKIVNAVEKLYPSLEILRASFNGDQFTVFLSDNSYATFSKSGDFEYLTNGNISKSDLPIEAQNYINTYYPDDLLKKVTLTQTEAWDRYETLLKSGIKLFFKGDGSLMGSFEYGFAPSDLPADALSYLQQIHPGEIITNVTFDNKNMFDPRYIVYLSSDAKVYFDGNGGWYETLYYRIKEDQLPDNILEYFVNNYPTSVFSEINYTVNFYDESSYDILTVDSKWFSFGDDGVLIDLEFEDFEESDLPTTISSYINSHFPNKEISEIYYYSYDYGSDEGYDIYFDDGLNVEFNPSGEVIALYGDNILHLPLPVRNYIETNYPNIDLLYCSYNKLIGYTSYLGPDEMVFHNWDFYFTGNLWLGLDEGLNFVYFLKYEAAMSDLIAPINSYFSTNYPGYLTVFEYSKYYSPLYSQIIYYVFLDDNNEFIFDEAGNLLDQFKKARKNVAKKSNSEKNLRSKRAETIKKLKEKQQLSTK